MASSDTELYAFGTGQEIRQDFDVGADMRCQALWPSAVSYHALLFPWEKGTETRREFEPPGLVSGD